ncbi:MAG: hypothetical protein M3O33_17635 [Cyanobacteriota bacterium]|nr:hypothetical protein [Cyanobacteriota bacterium]
MSQLLPVPQRLLLVRKSYPFGVDSSHPFDGIVTHSLLVTFLTLAGMAVSQTISRAEAKNKCYV